MSDEEERSYRDGDIVWVKLGGTWWPGEVTDKAPEDFTSKKPPLAIVKFFNEDSYEFVKSHNQIYPYNCSKKNDFIRKGMDSFRANNTHMSKFPGDVTLAEMRTEGNPNILSDPTFGPQKKTNVIAEVFGSPSPKKKEKSRLSKKKKKPKLNITHRRFLGLDDYEAHIRLQYPGKDTEHLEHDDRIVHEEIEFSRDYNCSACRFNTNRIDVMLFHVQCHIKGINAPLPKKKTTKKKKLKHITSDEDGNSLFNTDSEEEKPKPKRRKKTTPRKPKQKKEVKADITSDLLAEWSDDDDENEEKTEDVKKSCFDFDEEDEDSLPVIGKKIPRVIPLTERIIDDEDKSKEDEASLTTEDERSQSNSITNDSDNAKDDEAFKDLLDSTSVPDLPNELTKSDSFLNNKPQDKATKLTNPKKRFVKSFEDFEKAQEEKEEKEKIESEEQKSDHLQISKLKTQIMSKLGDDEEKEENKSHKSKILESYRNDKRKSVEEEEEEKPAKVIKLKEVAEEAPEKEEEDNIEEKKEENLVDKVEEEAEEKVEEKLEEKQEDKLEDKEEKLEENIEEPEENKEEKLEENNEGKVEENNEEKLEDKTEEKLEDKLAEDKIEEKLEEDKADDEIEKIKKIDEYLNDFLFDCKPEETSKEEAEEKEDISGLQTLAIVSELEKPTEELKPVEEKQAEVQPEPEPEPEMVPIDGNLTTVVTEKELANSQVEITASTSPTNKKPVTLTNFSMDFSECNSNSTIDSEETEKKEEGVNAENCDLEDHIPSQIVDKSVKEISAAAAATATNSKLMERLTEPKKVPTPTKPKKFIVKQMTKPSKPVILSEKIIQPISDSGSVSVQKITSKHNIQDPDDEIDTFIIQKGAKKDEESEEEESDKKLQVSAAAATSVKKRGKAKILQQTIITPAGEIIPTTAPSTVADDNVFDINSMPIVLSDQILTPESIENMPILLSDSVEKTVKKTTPMRVLNKTLTTTPKQQIIKQPQQQQPQKILSSAGKILKPNSFTATSGKHGKFVIVTQAPSSGTTSKYTVGKRQVLKKVPAGTLTKVQNVNEASSSGNKIMILTDQQGQQQRVLLTPAQQKMMGYQSATGSRMSKTIVKGNIIQKVKDGLAATPGSSGVRTTTPTSTRLNSTPQAKPVRIEKTIQGRKLQIQSHKVPINTTTTTAKPQRTILIKNQHGQTVRKIQGTDDALLDKQVAEQIEAIKASGVLHQKQKSYKKQYSKKVDATSTPKLQKPVKEATVPPLAPISPKKIDDKASTTEPKDRALHQLVIQDAMGNQTTITEGQILALPSETVDGQPQSYMLVTLDESGNLTPLNNEALSSLDPNLGLGDLNSIQLDETTKTSEEKAEPSLAPATAVEKEAEPPMSEPMNDGQQLIVTGDPIAAQKFLESLTEGNSDLANILASAEGSSILIQADGQQILINTDTADNQMLLSVNTDNNLITSEGVGNPIFSSQPPKNQDILAAALADTDVFPNENGQKLSPNNGLYPMNVGNVLETSLTLNSPIMTPLEVPSTKKMTDENILSQVPKNVDLPITITDPNISQTVSQQQVNMSTELNNLELTISESIATTEMNSPSFGYCEIKPFNSSMPLLTEDDSKTDDKVDNAGFLDESEGLCTLGSEMCSSLSEPPPDMFDLSAVLSSHDKRKKGELGEEKKIDEEEEDSCEIPVQPEIVASLKEDFDKEQEV